MNIDSNTISLVVKRALDVLLLNNPFVTVMGLLLGAIFAEFVPVVFAPMIQAATGIDLSEVSWYAWLFLGVFVLNLKSLMLRHKLPKDLETAFAVIEEARKRGISDREIELKYKLLIQKYVNAAVSTKHSQGKEEELRRQLGGD